MRQPASPARSASHKPDGLTILDYADIEHRIWPLPARKINGIGPRANEKLAAIGITTVGELAQSDTGLLQETFGRNYAEWLARIARGVDDRPVVTSSEPKSMSRETTFERDLHVRQDRPALSAHFTALCTRVSEDLARKGYVGRTVGIKLRFADFRTVTRDVTLPEATADATAIRRAATECLRRVVLDRRLRLLGVRVSALEKTGNAATGELQHSLLLEEEVQKPPVVTTTGSSAN
jgi:DNA polymerase IV